MKYVSLPFVPNPRPLPFYLAMEEHLAKNHRSEPELWFSWIVPPTVIVGRNQILEQEVDTAFCRDNGIAIYRRKSGGGAVYSDYGNIMLSYVCDGTDVPTIFRRYATRAVAILRSLGLNAEISGRNDVLVNGAKVSGNAFYQLDGRSIVHGTMLFNTDLSMMTSALTPSAAKLKSKVVESVRSRVITLSPLLPGMNINDFTDAMTRTMTDGILKLTDSDVSEIERIMSGYMTPEWIYGHNPRYTAAHTTKIEGVGEFNVLIEKTVGNRIRRVDMSGDFFPLGNLDELLHSLKGVTATREAVAGTLAGTDVSGIIAGLTTTAFINLIIPNP